MKIAFLGTSKFSKVYRDALISAGYDLEDGITPESKVDLGIIAYYGKLLEEKILMIPKMGFINVHYSLLPRWRGPSPIQSAILAGDSTTGVTILKVVKKADAGDIIAQEIVTISPDETYFEIERRLDEIGPGLLIKSLPQWIEGKIIPQIQDESKVTRAKLIKTEDGKINWSEGTQIISRKIRALNPSPGTYTFLDQKRLLILAAKFEIKSHNSQLGEVKQDAKSFKIATKDGFVLPSRLKLEGKKELAAEDFLHGRQDIIGKILI